MRPFLDTCTNDTGLMLTPEEDMRNWILEADKAGLHVSVHAIGNKGKKNWWDFVFILKSHSYSVEHI